MWSQQLPLYCDEAATINSLRVTISHEPKHSYPLAGLNAHFTSTALQEMVICPRSLSKTLREVALSTPQSCFFSPPRRHRSSWNATTYKYWEFPTCRKSQLIYTKSNRTRKFSSSTKEKDSEVSGGSIPRAEAKLEKKPYQIREQYTAVPKWYEPWAVYLLEPEDQPSLLFCKSKPRSTLPLCKGSKYKQTVLPGLVQVKL